MSVANHPAQAVNVSVKVYPAPAEYVMKIFRKRVNLNEDDTSRDVDFLTFSPMEKLAEVVSWHMGYSSWASHFGGWAKACGIDLEGNDERALSADMMLELMRKRSGLKADDSSQDDYLLSRTPLDKMRMLAGWELGFEEWGAYYVKWARDCGVQVSYS